MLVIFSQTDQTTITTTKSDKNVSVCDVIHVMCERII